MLYQLLGQTGLRVSELFLGAMTFHGRDRDDTAHKEYARIVETYAQAAWEMSSTPRSITAKGRARRFSASYSRRTVTALCCPPSTRSTVTRPTPMPPEITGRI